jgi:predicted DsbA family dithiol-disulfide isomerase
MGGLIADWRSYDDPLNDIRSPSQMGPQWFQVHEMSGMPLDDHLWQIDPPTSSYPACIAVKAAERQGPTAVEAYLRRLREAVMMERRNIARRDILLAVAQKTATDDLLDLDRFCADLDATEPMDSFRQDLRDAAYYGIGRFPTLILHRYDGRGIVLIGYRPYDALRAAIEHLVPDIIRTPTMSPEELAVAYVTRWRRVVARELMEVLDYDNLDQVQVMLQSLVANGSLTLADGVPIYMPANS